jgi:hypothetical protein
MNYTVTLDTYPQFLAMFSQQITSDAEFYVDIYDKKSLYINSPEYISGKSDNEIDMQDFILSLKDRYAYPAA